MSEDPVAGLRRVVKKMATVACPEELPLFEVVWNILEDDIRHWPGLPAGGPARRHGTSPEAAFGWPAKPQLRGLLIPKVADVLMQSMLELSSLQHRPGRDEIERSCRAALQQLEPKASLQRVLPHMAAIVEEEWTNLEPIQNVWRSKLAFRLFEGNSPERRCSAGERVRLREEAKRSETPIDIFVDDDASIFLVRGNKPKKIKPGQTQVFVVLKLLLQRVGGVWPYDDLHNEVMHEIPSTDSVVYSDVSRLMNSSITHLKNAIAEFAGKETVDTWFSTEGTRRVAVNEGLHSVLILKV